MKQFQHYNHKPLYQFQYIDHYMYIRVLCARTSVTVQSVVAVSDPQKKRNSLQSCWLLFRYDSSGNGRTEERRNGKMKLAVYGTVSVSTAQGLSPSLVWRLTNEGASDGEDCMIPAMAVVERQSWSTTRQ